MSDTVGQLDELIRDPQRDENRLQILIHLVKKLAEKVDELEKHELGNG